VFSEQYSIQTRIILISKYLLMALKGILFFRNNYAELVGLAGKISIEV